MARAHTAANNLRVLPALPACGCLVAKRRVWGCEAGFEEQVVRSLVAESVRVLAPCPEVWILNRLSRELRLEHLGAATNHPKRGCCGEKLKGRDVDVFQKQESYDRSKHYASASSLYSVTLPLTGAPTLVQAVVGVCRAHMQVLKMAAFSQHCLLDAAS